MSVVYLTGAPATGKSTLSRNLQRAFPQLLVFSYSERLRAKIASRTGNSSLGEEEIRAQSSSVVTPDDVNSLDQELIALVSAERRSRSIVVDSHPVTKEGYGYRVTSFSLDQLRELNPDIIVCLYANSDTLINRIRENSMGRPMVTSFEADFHSVMQAQVATQYGILLGKPVYLLDSGVSEDQLLRLVVTKAKIV